MALSVRPSVWVSVCLSFCKKNFLMVAHIKNGSIKICHISKKNKNGPKGLISIITIVFLIPLNKNFLGNNQWLSSCRSSPDQLMNLHPIKISNSWLLIEVPTQSWLIFLDSVLRSCSQQNINATINECTSSLLSIGSQTNITYLTFCDERNYHWQLPLMFFTIVMLTLFVLSSIVISKIMHKIMDPSFVLHTSLTCIPIRFLGYIWPDDQKILLGALLHFYLAPSSDTLKESNEKLCAKTGKDLMYWSIRNGYIEIIHLILSVVGKFIKS